MKIVQFDEDQYTPRHLKKKKRKHADSELVSWVIEKGWIKNKNFVSVIFILISIFFIFLSVVFFTEGKAFGFSDKFQNRSNETYYITIPGVEDPVPVTPGEEMSDVLERYNK